MDAQLPLDVAASTGSDQISIVNGSRDRDGSGATTVGMAHSVGNSLHLVGGEVVVVPQNMVAGRSRGSLHTEVGTEVEVEAFRRYDSSVDLNVIIYE